MVVAEEFERGAMRLVGPRLRLRADNTGTGNAEFGIVVSCGDLGLRDGFECRIDHNPAENGVVIIGTVEQMRGARETLTVDQHTVRTLRVLSRGGGNRGGEGDHARRHQLEVGEASVQDREFGDGTFGIGGGNVTTFGLEYAGVGRDFHGLADRTEFQRDIDADFGIHGHEDVVLHGGLEAFRLDANTILSGDEKPL